MAKKKKSYPNCETLPSGKARYNKRIKVEGQVIRLQSPAVFESEEAANNELQYWLERLRREGLAALRSPKQAPTIGELAREWLEVVVPVRCRISTLEDYRQIVRKHIPESLSNLPADQVTRKHVKALLLSKIREGLAASTVTHIKNALSGILALAVDGEWLPVNPARDVGRLWDDKPSGASANPFTAEEVKQLLDAFAANEALAWYRPLIIFLLSTGLRFGEAAGLRWPNVRLDEQLIIIEETWSRGRRGLTKNGKLRPVDIPGSLVGVLQAHNLIQRRAALANRWGASQLVFRQHNSGAEIQIDVFRRQIWKRALVEAGLPHHRIHDLRHTYATLRITAGHDMHDVSNQLGHHSAAFTLRQYVRWRPGTRRGEVDELGTLVSGGS